MSSASEKRELDELVKFLAEQRTRFDELRLTYQRQKSELERVESECQHLESIRLSKDDGNQAVEEQSYALERSLEDLQAELAQENHRIAPRCSSTIRIDRARVPTTYPIAAQPMTLGTAKSQNPGQPHRSISSSGSHMPMHQVQLLVQ